MVDLHSDNPVIVALREENAKLWEKIKELEWRIDKQSEILHAAKESTDDLEERMVDAERRLNRRNYKLYEKRLQRTDELLVKNQNRPISFSDMGHLQGFQIKTRRQSMTKLGHVYEQSPNKYQVSDSKLGGKMVKLTSSYYYKLIKGGV